MGHKLFFSLQMETGFSLQCSDFKPEKHYHICRSVRYFNIFWLYKILPYFLDYMVVPYYKDCNIQAYFSALHLFYFWQYTIPSYPRGYIILLYFQVYKPLPYPQDYTTVYCFILWTIKYFIPYSLEYDTTLFSGL